MVAHNVPAPLSSFVGRQRERADLAALLPSRRLVTLVGPPGVGKTRLALEVAGGVVPRYSDGVRLVELTPLGDPALVPQAVASAVGVRERGGVDLIDTLTAHLHPQERLLVLDNCEHLLGGAARLTGHLLRSCPRLSVLATSREPLGLPGECVRRVDPLAAPPHEAPATDLEAYDAVRLFVERAETIESGFRLTPEWAPAVAEICRRLDGVPLAIELAAALLDVLSPPEIAVQLDERLRLLTRSHSVAGGHVSLQAALDWSHNLLSDAEAVVLRRLSVFAGGCPLDAVTAVCAGHPVGPERIIEVLGGLIRKSLVSTERRGADTRYWLLETVRDYAARKLEAAGETDAVRHLHCAWCVDLAERGEQEIAAGHRGWLERLETEQGNLRAAFEFALTSGSDAALQLGAALVLFWWLQGHVREGRQLLERALTTGQGRSEPVRAKATWAMAFLAKSAGDLDAASSLGEESLVLAEAAGDTATRVRARTLLGLLSMYRSPAKAVPVLRENAALARAEGGGRLLISALMTLSTALVLSGDAEEARLYLLECLELTRRDENRAQMAATLDALGQASLSLGDLPAAETYLREGLALAAEVGERGQEGLILCWLGELARERGDYVAANAALAKALEIARGLDRPVLVARSLCFFGRVAVAEGDLARAARCFSESLPTARRLELGYLTARCLLGLAQASLAGGDAVAAETALDDAELVAGAHGDRQGLAACLVARARLARVRGPVERAQSLGHEALTLQEEIGDRSGAASSLELLAALRNPPADAVRLFAAAQALRDLGGYARPPVVSTTYESDVAALRDALADRDFAQAWDEGAALSFAEAVAYARRGRGGRRRPATGWASLTPAEADVARLAAQGLTNQEIGRRLFVSPRTVGTHLAHVYTKLGISSRRELATLAGAEGGTARPPPLSLRSDGAG